MSTTPSTPGPVTMRAHLQAALDAARPFGEGRPAASPRPLSPDAEQPFGIAVATVGGELFAAGDTDVEFPLQSISKAVVYGMALEEHGFDAVEACVDIEPSGESYDAISVEDGTGRPDNPMINAGAMTVHALVGGFGSDAARREERILAVYSALAGRELAVDEEVFEFEYASCHRNLAIAHMLRALDVLPDDPRDVVRGYLRQCAVSVTTADLALMGATLAAGGRNPRTGEQVFSRDVVRQVLSVMMTCGMYDSAGDWVSEVGIPAKSGVGGGILGVLPGRGGIVTFSPRLDKHGNSVRGQLAFEYLSDGLGIHFVDALYEDDERWERAVTTGAAGSAPQAAG